MKRKPSAPTGTRSPDRDLLAHDIYERAMFPYWDLQAEADRERLLRQVPVTGPARPSRLRTSLAAVGSLLVALGLWMKSAGKR